MRILCGHADRLFPPPQGVPAAGFHARAPDASRGARQARDLAFDRRLLHVVARVLRQGRAALRPLRPRVRVLLQGHRRDPRHPRRDSRGVAEKGVRALSLGRGQEARRGDGRVGQAHGDAQAAPRGAARPAPGRQEMDRHRRHEPVRRVRLQPGRRAHRTGRRRRAQRGQGVGRAHVPQPRRRRRAQHAQHQGRAAPLAHASRAKACRTSSTCRAPSRAPRATRAGSTCTCSPSGATGSRCCCSSTSAGRWTRTCAPARSSSRRPRPSSVTSNTSTSTTASTTTCGATTEGDATSGSPRSTSSTSTGPTGR